MRLIDWRTGRMRTSFGHSAYTKHTVYQVNDINNNKNVIICEKLLPKYFHGLTWNLIPGDEFPSDRGRKQRRPHAQYRLLRWAQPQTRQDGARRDSRFSERTSQSPAHVRQAGPPANRTQQQWCYVTESLCNLIGWWRFWFTGLSVVSRRWSVFVIDSVKLLQCIYD